MAKLFEFRIYKNTEEPVPLCWKVLASLFTASIFLAMAVVCNSCQGEDVERNVVEEGHPATIRVEVQAEEEVDIATRAVDETVISNLHILIYNSLGELIGQKYQTGSASIIVSTTSASNCTIYAIANTGKADLFKGYDIHQESYLKSMMYSMINWDDLMKGIGLPMTGNLKNVNIKSGKQTVATPLVLTRIVAKITLNIGVKPGSGITITNFKIYNLPKNSNYIPGMVDASTTWLNSGVIRPSSATTAVKTFYMFENRRGIKSSITQQKDKNSTNAPVNATYVEINGDINSITAKWKVYLGENNTSDFNINRNCSYQYNITLTATYNGENGMAADSRVLIGVDLNEDGPANCYLVAKDNEWYNFVGTIRGNGQTEDYALQQYGSGISLMPSRVGGSVNAVVIPKEQIKDAVVLWETNSGIIQKLNWDSSSGYVKFKTGTAKGNALIAVRDKSNTILWSWHIWRTNGVNLAEFNKNHTLEIRTNTNRSWYANSFIDINVGNAAKRERDLILMECKLGAQLNKGSHNSILDGDIGAFNLTYQFGRKDPFPLNAASNEEDDFSKNAVDAKTTGSAIQENINYSIQHPTVFIKGDNWINSGTALNTVQWKVSNCLWGDNHTAKGNLVSTNPPPCSIMDPAPWGTERESGKKTIYDPCPSGWRVSPADTWSGIANSTIASWFNLRGLIWEEVSECSFIFHFGSMSGVSTFIPASGYRNATDALIKMVGKSTYFWNSSPCGPDYALSCVTYAGGDQMHIAHAGKRSCGFSVRCVKE